MQYLHDYLLSHHVATLIPLQNRDSTAVNWNNTNTSIQSNYYYLPNHVILILILGIVYN